MLKKRSRSCPGPSLIFKIKLHRDIQNQTTPINHTNKPVIIGHRGIAGRFPENTLCSIQAAIDEGLSWVEVDVQPTLDGTLVLSHDHSLERCSNGQGKIAKHTIEQLSLLDFGYWKGEDFRNQPIATLAELLSLAKQHSLRLNLEMKLSKHQLKEEFINQVVINTLTLIKKRNFPLDQIIFSSFRPQILRALNKHSPTAKLGVLSERLKARDWKLIREINAYSCHLNYQWLTHSHIAKLKKVGIKVGCFTVNEPLKFKYLNSVDAIFTDFPERFHTNHSK